MKWTIPAFWVLDVEKSAGDDKAFMGPMVCWVLLWFVGMRQDGEKSYEREYTWVYCPLGKWSSSLLMKLICKLLFLIVCFLFVLIGLAHSAQSNPDSQAREYRQVERDRRSQQPAQELYKWPLCCWLVCRWAQGKAKEYGWDTNIACYWPLPETLSGHSLLGGKIPEWAHLRLQRRFLFAALFLWSRSSRPGLWAAPGSFLEPSSFHRQLQCGPGDKGLWW